MSDVLSVTGPDRFLNRELSWLDFNERVLAIAESEAMPPLERAKFLAIFSSNLDEFFQVRVAGLKDQVAAGVTGMTPDGRTARTQLREIRDRVDVLTGRAGSVLRFELIPALAAEGVTLCRWADLDDAERKFVIEDFGDRVLPVLTPHAIDTSHPFPYISNLSLNILAILRSSDADRLIARVKVPSLLPRFVFLPDGGRFIALEEVISAQLDRLFPGMEIAEHHLFRVIRNADLEFEEDESEDLLEAVEMEIRRRRFGRTVRLEIEPDLPAEVRTLLERQLEVEPEDVAVTTGLMDLGGLWSVYGVDRPDLRDPPWAPMVPRRLQQLDEPREIFEVISQGDLVVHHPYESFTASVEELLRQASLDADVLAIKMTLYRTSGDGSIVESLVRAAESGKQVAVLVELKARFDEAANIEWARRLENAGVHVVYGIVGLKTHAKITMVVRSEPEGIRRYCHVGTGNYNAKTAKLYEDIGILSADVELAEDLTTFFNSLTGYGRAVDYHRLLAAPDHLRHEMLAMIENETNYADGRIVMKMNSLVDEQIIDALYAASQKGVSVVLIVRGICCLRPRVAGLSENIRVRSIIGRYLEHSRIYHFAHGWHDGEPAWYIGSADLMPRNLDRRVEALLAVTEPEAQRRLSETLEVNLSSPRLAWELRSDGTWKKLKPGVDPGSQERLRQLASDAARSVPNQ